MDPDSHSLAGPVPRLGAPRVKHEPVFFTRCRCMTLFARNKFYSWVALLCRLQPYGRQLIFLTSGAMRSDRRGAKMCPTLRPSQEQFEKPFAEYVQNVFRRHPDWPCFKASFMGSMGLLGAVDSFA